MRPLVSMRRAGVPMRKRGTLSGNPFAGRSFRDVVSGPAGSCPSRGWGLRGGIVKASLSRGTQARGHTRALARGGSEGILRWRLAVSESPAGIAAVSRREVSERIGLG
jgi:hypothetical protein